MYIAHSALRQNKQEKTNFSEAVLQQRIAAYRLTCQKYKQEIAAIQKYLPGWMPAFGRSL